jgi:hypothetical protein
MAIAAYVCGLGLLFSGAATRRRDAPRSAMLASPSYLRPHRGGQVEHLAMFSTPAAAAARVARTTTSGSLPT